MFAYVLIFMADIQDESLMTSIVGSMIAVAISHLASDFNLLNPFFLLILTDEVVGNPLGKP